jgi:uncharacterized RDD family membrane protein YckC
LSGVRPSAEPAGWRRRIASIVYESILILAIVFIATAIFPGAATGRLPTATRVVLFIYLISLVGLYLTWSWTRGHTLAMKAWRLSVVDNAGRPLRWARALARYLAALALIGTMIFALLWVREHRTAWLAWALIAPGLLALAWPLWDSRRRALYDLAAGTQLIWTPRSAPLNPPHHDDGRAQK